MNALLVGADRLGNIPDVLHNFGIRIAAHVSGRDTTHQRRSAPLPSGIGVVILFTDFLGHNVMQRFREAAGKQGVPGGVLPALDLRAAAGARSPDGFALRGLPAAL